MKTVFLTCLAVVFSISIYAQDQQIAIGKTSVDGDALVDFGTELRGMVLAPVLNAATISNPTPGTIVFDGATGSFRFYNGTWSAAVAGGQTGGSATGTDTFQQLIGTTQSSASGVAIFGKDTGETQALVLPKLANGNLRFSNPVPGLIYYDTALKAVMVYNGNGWTRF